MQVVCLRSFDEASGESRDTEWKWSAEAELGRLFEETISARHMKLLGQQHRGEDGNQQPRTADELQLGRRVSD